MKTKSHKLFFRIMFFVIGLMLFAFGIAVTIIADFGVSAWDAVSVGLLGGWLRHERPKLSCMITSFVMSGFVDFFVWLMNGVSISPWIGKLTLFLVGVIIISIGCGTYLVGNFAPCPIDYFMVALRDKFQTNIRTAMTLCEGSGFILAFLVSGPIGLGTLLSVFIYGPLIQYFHQHAKELHQSLLYRFP